MRLLFCLETRNFTPWKEFVCWEFFTIHVIVIYTVIRKMVGFKLQGRGAGPVTAPHQAHGKVQPISCRAATHAVGSLANLRATDGGMKKVWVWFCLLPACCWVVGKHFIWKACTYSGRRTRHELLLHTRTHSARTDARTYTILVHFQVSPFNE